jgi:hypothetical protein
MTEPLTPPDCDLRDYPWMPIDCTRLLTSETWMLGTSDQKVAAFTLWAKSWHQVPAGSLPNNDRMLAAMSEAGGRWNRVRDHALRGWVLCSDGRLYHPVVCEKARESWDRKLAQKARTAAARLAKLQKLVDALTEASQPSVTTSVTETATEDVTGSNVPDQTVPDQTVPDQTIKEDPHFVRDARTMAEENNPRPDEWEGQWRKTRVSGTSPRQVGDNPRNRGFRLPDGWEPDVESAAVCRDLGLNVAQVMVKFRDHWIAQPGAKGLKLNWNATFRNWCRREAERPRPPTHTLSPAEQDRRILSAVGLGFEDPPPLLAPKLRVVT